MVTYSNKVSICVEAPNPNKCTEGQYITINGKAYKYEYSQKSLPPSTYDKYPSTPDFCIYYTGAYIVYGGDGNIIYYQTIPSLAGCYCYPGMPCSNLSVKSDGTWFQTDGNGHWFAGINLSGEAGQIRILWNE